MGEALERIVGEVVSYDVLPIRLERSAVKASTLQASVTMSARLSRDCTQWRDSDGSIAQCSGKCRTRRHGMWRSFLKEPPPPRATSMQHWLSSKSGVVVRIGHGGEESNMRRRRRHTGTTALAHRSAATSSASVVLWVEIDAGQPESAFLPPYEILDTQYKIHELPNFYQRRLPTDGSNVSYTSFYHFGSQ